MGGRYTDAQLNSCFKKVKVKLKEEKSLMARLAEAGENVLLLDMMKKRKKRRDIVEKVNKEFFHTWRKR